MALSTDGTESVCGENAFPPLLFTTLFYIIYIIYTFGYFTHTVYTHSLPCVFIHYMCFVCILRLHPCAKRYVLFRAISSSIHY